MLGRITDLAVDFRSAGRPPRRLGLGELLLELGEQGVDPYLLEDIAGSVGRDGFFFGHHNYRRFAVFLPVSSGRTPAGLLIVVRDGSVRTLITDTPMETTIVDSDYAPAKLDSSPPVVVSADEYRRVRSTVLAELAEPVTTDENLSSSVERTMPRGLA